MDSFNILIHVDSDNLIINDHELIINKKIGSFLNVKNYEVCLTHVIPNHQFLNNGYGIEIYNLCKPFDHMFVLLDPDLKSISLKISDIEPDDSPIKFFENLHSAIINIIKAHYVFFVEKLGATTQSIHINNGELISFCNEKKRYTIVSSESSAKKFTDTISSMYASLSKYEFNNNTTTFRDMSENIYNLFKKKLGSSVKITEISYRNKQFLELVDLKKQEFKTLDFKTIKKLAKIYDELKPIVKLSDVSFVQDSDGSTLVSLGNNLEFSFNGLVAHEDDKKIFKIKDKSKIKVLGLEKSPLLLSSELVAYSYFNSKYLQLLHIYEEHNKVLPYSKVVLNSISGINIRVNLLENVKRYFNSNNDILINLNFRKNELE